jgi:hypothetical protein
LGYSSHILNTGHTQGMITGNGHYKKTEKKSISEKYHIYKISKKKNLNMNDTTLIHKTPYSEHCRK